MLSRFAFAVAFVFGLFSPAAAARPGLPETFRSDGPPPTLELPLQLVAFGEDPISLNQVGTSMEVQGNYLFIGAPGDGQGRVDIWYRAPYGYVFIQRFTMPSAISGDSQLGRSLAVDGGVLVAGTARNDNSGHVVVYRRAPNGLYFESQILAPGGGHVPLSFFGDKVAVLENEVVAVAARGQFAVHVYEALPNGNFPLSATRVLDPVNTGIIPDMTWMNGFGSNVGVHRAPGGPVSVLVGLRDACFYQTTYDQAPDEETPDGNGFTAARTGSVAVLQKSGGTWQVDHQMIPEFSRVKDFGFEIDVEGSRVAVGAIYSRVFSNGFDAGTATVYEWNGDEFGLVDTIWPSLPYQNAWFGYSVELSGEHLLVGQPGLWGGPQGLVQIFRIGAQALEPNGLIWAPDGNPAADGSSLGDSFGREIVVNDYGEVLVSAPFSAPNAGAPPQYGGGALYLFK